MYSNLYLDSIPLEYRAECFLERRSPCSGIAESSLHVFQRRGIVKKVTVPDSEGGALKGKSLPRRGTYPWCPPGSAAYDYVNMEDGKVWEQG